MEGGRVFELLWAARPEGVLNALRLATDLHLIAVVAEGISVFGRVIMSRQFPNFPVTALSGLAITLNRRNN